MSKESGFWGKVKSLFKKEESEELIAYAPMETGDPMPAEHFDEEKGWVRDNAHFDSKDAPYQGSDGQWYFSLMLPRETTYRMYGPYKTELLAALKMKNVKAAMATVGNGR